MRVTESLDDRVGALSPALHLEQAIDKIIANVKRCRTALTAVTKSATPLG